MGVVPVDEETNEVISTIARKLRVSREEVIRMLVNGEVGEIIGDEMNPEMEKKMAELMAKGDSKSVIDKMMELKMMERLESGGAEKKGTDMSELMEIMKVKMMMEAMQTKNNQSIDPNMLMMMMLMKNNDGSKTDMTKIIEAMTQSINTKDSSTAELLKELLNEKKEDEREQELMAVIEQQNRMIEELKRQQEDIQRAMMYKQRNEGDRRKKDPEDEIISSVQKIEKMKDTFERVGIIKPPSAEDREIAIKQDVVKAKADLERETMQTQAELTKDLMKGIDSKFDKVLTIVETLLKQPSSQREQTLDEFQRRGQITEQERQQIYAQMQQQIAMQQQVPEPQPTPPSNLVSEERGADIGTTARQMWEQGYDATTIAKKLHIPITQTYQYRPKEGQ